MSYSKRKQSDVTFVYFAAKTTCFALENKIRRKRFVVY